MGGVAGFCGPRARRVTRQAPAASATFFPRRGSRRDYLDLLNDLWVEADVLSRKVAIAAETLAEFQESLSDDG